MRKITVGICTYRRPEGLRSCLESIAAQKISAPDHYRIRILVADNAPDPQTAEIVSAIRSPFEIALVEEPRKGFSYVRNRIIREAAMEDALIFIDDDETANDGWLEALLNSWQALQAGIVVGPVNSVFAEGVSVPWWAPHIPAFKKPRFRTGAFLNVASTANILIDCAVFAKVPEFDHRFATGGEDSYFTRRAIQAGFSVRWCEEAAVTEQVPAERITLKWVVNRALNVGRNQDKIRLLFHYSPLYLPLRACLVMGKYGMLLLYALVTANRSRAVWNAYFFLVGTGSLLFSLGLRR